MIFNSQKEFQKLIHKHLKRNVSLKDISTNCVRVTFDAPRHSVGFRIKKQINEELHAYLLNAYDHLIWQSYIAIHNLQKRKIKPAHIFLPIEWLQLVLWFDPRYNFESHNFLNCSLHETSELYLPRVMGIHGCEETENINL